MDYLVVEELFLRQKCFDTRLKSFVTEKEASDYADQEYKYRKEQIKNGQLGDVVINVYKRIG